MYEATTEAFTLQFSTACASYSSYQDDLIAVMQLFFKQHPHGDTEREFLSEIYRVLEVRLDHSLEPQPDYLFKSPTVQRCLGMQLSLGYSGEAKPRPLPTKIAKAFLDIRSTTLLMTYTLKSISGVPNPENDPRKQQDIESRKAGTLPLSHIQDKLSTSLTTRTRRAPVSHRSRSVVHLPHGLHSRRALPTQRLNARTRLHNGH